jgi:hypothetical protein
MNRSSSDSKFTVVTMETTAIYPIPDYCSAKYRGWLIVNTAMVRSSRVIPDDLVAGVAVQTPPGYITYMVASPSDAKVWSSRNIASASQVRPSQPEVFDHFLVYNAILTLTLGSLAS